MTPYCAFCRRHVYYSSCVQFSRVVSWHVKDQTQFCGVPCLIAWLRKYFYPSFAMSKKVEVLK